MPMIGRRKKKNGGKLFRNLVVALTLAWPILNLIEIKKVVFSNHLNVSSLLENDEMEMVNHGVPSVDELPAEEEPLPQTLPTNERIAVNDYQMLAEFRNASFDATVTKRDPINLLIPKRLITVAGLESSGTKFLTMLTAQASGAYRISEKQKESGKVDLLPFWDRVRSKGIEVQHVSLPWGEKCSNRANRNHTEILANKTIDALIPKRCVFSRARNSAVLNANNLKHFHMCRELGVPKFTSIPGRYFLNLTSHIKWYQERGSIATAVVVVRDQTIEYASKLREHCHNHTLAKEENEYGMEIIREALLNLSEDWLDDRTPPSLVLVSYESLMSIGEPYARKYIFEKLGLGSSGLNFSRNDTYNIDKIWFPPLKDGNRRYVEIPKSGHKGHDGSKGKFPTAKAGRIDGKSSLQQNKYHDDMVGVINDTLEKANIELNFYQEKAEREGRSNVKIAPRSNRLQRGKETFMIKP